MRWFQMIVSGGRVVRFQNTSQHPPLPLNANDSILPQPTPTSRLIPWFSLLTASNPFSTARLEKCFWKHKSDHRHSPGLDPSHSFACSWKKSRPHYSFLDHTPAGLFPSLTLPPLTHCATPVSLLRSGTCHVPSYLCLWTHSSQSLLQLTPSPLPALANVSPSQKVLWPPCLGQNPCPTPTVPLYLSILLIAPQTLMIWNYPVHMLWGFSFLSMRLETLAVFLSP